MDKEDNDEGWWRFLKLCQQVKSAEDLNEFFYLFLTLEEKEDLAGRYRIVEALLKGEMTQRQMSDELKVSIAKITRGSNSLKLVSERMRNFLKKRIK